MNGDLAMIVAVYGVSGWLVIGLVEYGYNLICSLIEADEEAHYS